MSNAKASGGTSARTASVGLLLWTVLRMNFLLLARYKVNFAAQILGIYLFFAIIFFGGQAAVENVGGSGAGSLGSTLDAFIVGWFLWTMAQTAYFSLSREVTQESRWGTLEQLYMSPHGFGTIMISKVCVNIFLSLILGMLILALMMVSTGRYLAFDVISILPIALLTLMSIVGIGFIFAGLTLIYKKLDSVSQLMQFVIIGLIAAPSAGSNLLALLPLVQGSSMMQVAMRDGVRLWEFSLLEIGILCGTAIFYSVVGYMVFQFCARVARSRGLMGQY
ncbi:ABC transporter permease [Natronolimnohabitans sp. A-GB9]|uniref:ABC transporter permease n=1 Tax=Natronolimnohabitans sp. A-GB9 TaxID=3069757 RepID=UPI0027B64E98|nr:ABC transporter permease [Natronolimnohabitans sp. A-GB9]MDQ2051182.1 ABC transporter permease [Natronolimnohabitans sp. A-GB9]